VKIYLAGNPRTDFERLTYLRAQILVAGHQLSFDWLSSFEAKKAYESLDTWHEDRLLGGLHDLGGVRGCDLLVLLDAPVGWGMYTEFGFALALNKPVLVVDPKYLQIFFHHPRVTVTEWSKVMDRIEDFAVLLEQEREEQK